MNTIKIRRAWPALIAVTLLLVFVPPPAEAQASQCPSDAGYDNSVSTREAAGNSSNGSRLRSYSRNYVQNAHCYNDHNHSLRSFRNGAWRWEGNLRCATWSTDGQFIRDYQTAGELYQCWANWNVNTGVYYHSDMNSYTIRSRWHWTKGRMWDYDTALPTDCWRRNSNGTWSRSCN